MIELFVKGGPVMYFIALAAISATVIIVERFLFYHSLKKEQKTLLPRLQQCIQNGQYDKAIRLCKKSESSLARITMVGLEHRYLDTSAIQELVVNAANQEIPRLERFVNMLGTIANIATLLGLLGTVTGNIQAFGVLAASGAMGNPALLAGAIAEALITTAAGLIVSIPVTIFYNYFVGKATNLTIELESSVSNLMALWNTNTKKDKIACNSNDD